MFCSKTCSRLQSYWMMKRCVKYKTELLKSLEEYRGLTYKFIYFIIYNAIKNPLVC